MLMRFAEMNGISYRFRRELHISIILKLGMQVYH